MTGYNTLRSITAELVENSASIENAWGVSWAAWWPLLRRRSTNPKFFREA